MLYLVVIIVVFYVYLKRTKIVNWFSNVGEKYQHMTVASTTDMLIKQAITTIPASDRIVFRDNLHVMAHACNNQYQLNYITIDKLEMLADITMADPLADQAIRRVFAIITIAARATGINKTNMIPTKVLLESFKLI